MPVVGFHGAGPARRMFGMRRANDRKSFGEFDSREVCTETVLDAAAERQHRRRTLASDVEVVRLIEYSGIAVGGGRVGDNQRAGRDGDAGQFDVLLGDARRREDDRRVAHHLFDGVGREFGALRQQRPLVGVVAEHLHRGGQLVTGGIGAGHQQCRGQHQQLVVAQAVAVHLGAHHVGEQVVGQCVTAAGDQWHAGSSSVSTTTSSATVLQRGVRPRARCR